MSERESGETRGWKGREEERKRRREEKRREGQGGEEEEKRRGCPCITNDKKKPRSDLPQGAHFNHHERARAEGMNV